MSKPQADARPADFHVPESDVETGAPNAPVVIKGRNVEVPEHFVNRIKAKLARVERLDPSIIRFEVELRHERNPRQSRTRDRLEITVRRKGAPARAEAGEDSFYAALESALDKLERVLRKTKVRRRISRSGHRTPISVSEATAELAKDDSLAIDAEVGISPESTLADDADGEDEGPGRIARTKVHEATPMSVDDALYQMELVGHDFFLFQDEETGRPSVVYRRHAFDYGLITLGE